MKQEKDQSVETLRGIAILLVVAGYIIRDDIFPLDKTQPSLTVSILKYIEHTLATIRMPLFTVISGYLYASAPASIETLKKLIFGKFRRVMIPFLSFSTIQFLFFLRVPDSKYELSQMYRIYIWPHEQLWFLMAVFIIFALVGLLDAFKALSTPRRYLQVSLIAAFFHITIRFPGAFALYGVNYLLPFFLLGYGLRKYSAVFFVRNYFPVMAIIFLISVCIQPVYYAITNISGDPPFHFRRVVDLLVPFSAFPLLFYYRKTVPFLAFLGSYSFGIYLFHRLSITTVRLTFQSYGLYDPLIIFGGYLIGGIAIAFLIQIFCEQFTLTSKLILGLKGRPEKSLFRLMK